MTDLKRITPEEVLAEIYTSKDNSRDPNGTQYFAEVVSNAGGDDERVLYATGFYTSPHPAITDAENWMKKNGVKEVDF